MPPQTLKVCNFRVFVIIDPNFWTFPQIYQVTYVLWLIFVFEVWFAILNDSLICHIWSFVISRIYLVLKLEMRESNGVYCFYAR